MSDQRNKYRTSQITRIRYVVTGTLALVILPLLGAWVGYSYATASLSSEDPKTAKTATLQDNPPCPHDNPPQQYTNGFHYKPGPEGAPESVCFQNKTVEVDAGTFARIYHEPYDYVAQHGTSSEDRARFAHDATAFYVDGVPVYSVEDNSYEAFGRYHFRIHDTVYAETGAGLQRDGGYVKPLLHADANSFRALRDMYARDDDTIYYRGEPFGGADSFNLIERSYPKGPHGDAGTYTFGVTDTAVYFKGERLKGINPDTFRVAPGGFYVADKDTIYIRRGGCNRASFEKGSFEDIETYFRGC